MADDLKVYGSVANISQATGDTVVLNIPSIGKSYPIGLVNGQFNVTVPDSDLAAIESEATIDVAATTAAGTVTKSVVIQRVEAAVISLPLAINAIGIISEAEGQAGITISGTGTAGRVITFSHSTPGVAIQSAVVASDGTWSTPFVSAEIQKTATNTDLTITADDGVSSVDDIYQYTAAASGAVFACNGIDVYSRYQAGSVPAAKPDYTATTTVTTQAQFEAACYNLNGTGGIVYLAAGADIDITTCRISGVSNIKVTTDPDNPGGFRGTGIQNRPPYSALIFRDCHDIELSNFYSTEVGGWGLNIGGDPNDSTPGVACSNITIKHLEISYCTLVGLKITSGSHDIVVEDTWSHNNGRVLKGYSGEGENVYCGDGGTSPANGVYNVTFTRLKANNSNGGENVDIKRNSYNVTLQHCELGNASVWSQGALTICINQLADAPDANILVKNCLVYGTVTEAHNGHGIVVGLGGTTIEECIVWNSVGYGISIYRQFNGPNDNVTMRNNIVFDNAAGAIDEASSNTADTAAPIITREGNLVDASPQGSDCLITSAVFVGPTTGTAAVSGGGPGSGFSAAP